MLKWNGYPSKNLWIFLTTGMLLIVGAGRPAQATPSNIAFSQSAQTIEAYDFVEINLNVSSPDAKNPRA